MDQGVPDLYPSEPLPIRLMNTVWADREGLHDSLATVAHLQQWSDQCGIRPSDELTHADLDRARALRDALRRAAAELLDDERPGAVDDRLSPTEALRVLNEFLAACVPEVRVDESAGLRGDWFWRVAGFARELAAIALESRDLFARAVAGIGACHGPGCVLYFERVPARREWCSTACGNRARVARHYRRQKAASRPHDGED